MATTYYQITEKELLALLATADSCYSMAGSGDEDFSREAEDAQKALKAIQKRNGIVIENNYAEVARSIKI